MVCATYRHCARWPPSRNGYQTVHPACRRPPPERSLKPAPLRLCCRREPAVVVVADVEQLVDRGRATFAHSRGTAKAKSSTAKAVGGRCALDDAHVHPAVAAVRGADHPQSRVCGTRSRKIDLVEQRREPVRACRPRKNHANDAARTRRPPRTGPRSHTVWPSGAASAGGRCNLCRHGTAPFRRWRSGCRANPGPRLFDIGQALRDKVFFVTDGLR